LFASPYIAFLRHTSLFIALLPSLLFIVTLLLYMNIITSSLHTCFLLFMREELESLLQISSLSLFSHERDFSQRRVTSLSLQKRREHFSERWQDIQKRIFLHFRRELLLTETSYYTYIYWIAFPGIIETLQSTLHTAYYSLHMRCFIEAVCQSIIIRIYIILHIFSLLYYRDIFHIYSLYIIQVIFIFLSDEHRDRADIRHAYIFYYISSLSLSLSHFLFSLLYRRRHRQTPQSRDTYALHMNYTYTYTHSIIIEEAYRSSLFSFIVSPHWIATRPSRLHIEL